MNYKLTRIAEICGGVHRGAQRDVCSVTTDSRSFQLGPEPMFVAIGGANHDGHAYIGQMYGRGVRAFLVERNVETAAYDQAGFVVVDNAVAALQKLAADHRDSFKGTVVAITGSNGKTVVKEWIAQLAPIGVKVFRSPKSYNSQLGVALSLMMIGGDEQIAIIEAGISKVGEMERLEAMIRPNIGIITTIGDAHQENFDSVEQKIDEKLKLFSRCSTILYNSNYDQIATKIENSHARLVDIAEQIAEHNDNYTIFADKASRENAAMAVALFDALGYDHQQTVGRLPLLQPVAMRLELKEGINNSLIINDSYNSDINSLSIALDYLKSVAGGRKQTLILSDILQSGLSPDELYGAVAQMIVASGVDSIIGIGDEIRRHSYLFECSREFYRSTDEFLNAINRNHTLDRAILIKGSRVSQFERLSHALQLKSHTTILEVDLDAMIHNLNYFRAKLEPHTKLMAMVKASSYGHGGYEVANMLQHQGVDYLAVAFADEGVLLRERGITMPMVVLNADSDSFELMVANSLEPEIYNFSSLESFLETVNRYGERNYPIHIKLDTGMNRLGFKSADIEVLTEMLGDNDSVVIVRSIFSHFAVSDDPSQDEFTRAQIAIFKDLTDRIISTLPYKPICHIANSAAIERLPGALFDMCRLGVGLYGVSADNQAALLAVSALRTRIVHIKDVEPDQSIGYGRAGHLTTVSRIATIPIGYADGLDRHLGCGKWSVMVNGYKAPIVGRICMDTCMIDVSGVDVQEGDSVTIYGKNEGNTIIDMARVLDTIPYEIMTSVSARVKRIYTKE